jgi:DNA-binding CsgD family transcriptional regulator
MTLDPAIESRLPEHTDRLRLTRRESAIICLVAEGLTNAEAAGRLHISSHTVAQHIAEMLYRIGARSRTELIARAYCSGILSTDSWPPTLLQCGDQGDTTARSTAGLIPCRDTTITRR